MARKKGILQEMEGKSGRFAVTFLCLFSILFGFLWLVDATPEAPSKDPAPEVVQPTTGTTNAPELPTRVVAKSIGLDAVVVNPTSVDIEVLDRELTKGAVRYPTSAQLGVNGTVLLFGHSSYLPVVYHQYYKVFNGIQNLKPGEVVSVYSGATEYRYKVTGVRRADASDPNESIVELPQDGKYLTLVTCNSFATKSDRFVVTAVLEGTHSTH